MGPGLRRSRVPRFVAALGLITNLAACGRQDAERSYLAFPEGAGTARSAVFSARDAARLTRIEAIDLELSPAAWEVEAQDGLLVEALFYDRSPAVLGLDAGPITPGPAESRRGLPGGARVFELGLTEAGPSLEGWVERGEKSSALEAFRLPEDGSECPRLRVTNHSLPSDLNGVCAGRLPGGEVLLGDTSGKLWLVSDAGLSAVSVIHPAGSAPVLTSIAVAPDTGELYFGSNAGELYRGTLDAGVLEVSFVARAPASTYLRFLQVVTGTPDVELHAMSVLGEVFHFTGGRFRLLHDFGRGGDLAGLQGFIRRQDDRGPEVLAVVAEDNRAASIRDGVVELQETGSPSGLVEIAEIEGLGPVVGNDVGQLFARVEGRWQPLGPTDVSLWLTVVTSVEPGLFLFATAFGNVGLFRDGASCGVQQLLPADPFWVEPVGDRAERRFIAFGDRPATAGLWYSELRLE